MVALQCMRNSTTVVKCYSVVIFAYSLFDKAQHVLGHQPLDKQLPVHIICKKRKKGKKSDKTENMEAKGCIERTDQHTRVLWSKQEKEYAPAELHDVSRPTSSRHAVRFLRGNQSFSTRRQEKIKNARCKAPLLSFPLGWVFVPLVVFPETVFFFLVFYSATLTPLETR